MLDSLIFKYSPSNINDLEISNSIKDLLKTFIEMNNLNLLFIGDSGAGKTTLIKVLISEYYKYIPENIKNDNILIINSLKEQGISYYRSEVKIFCQTTCQIANKKKFLILDDIDIINEQSQQVFRNCIDKYSKNVHFLASCINPQKVIDSIQSRINIIKLNQFSNIQLENIFNHITNKENIIFENDAKQFIISISNNSVRILTNYLEKFKLLKRNINLQIANEICSNILLIHFEEYTTFCKANNINSAINTIVKIYNEGFSVMDILDNYFIYVKLSTILDETHKFKIIQILCSYITIFHLVHEDEIELAFLTNNLISIFSTKE
tara:strand:- start:2611 stop:3579 length:969 start_codon:yes stop_codon:yes gene_type:complete